MQAKADQEAHRSKSAELDSKTGTMAPPRKHVSVAFSSAHAIIAT